MNNPYGSVHESPTSRSDNFTTNERNFLGAYTQRALLRFRDVNAYYCSECDECYGVYCPKCKIRTPVEHMPSGERVFRVSGERDRWDGHTWIKIICRKCDYEFKVIER